VMRPDEQQARKVFDVDVNSTIGGLFWTPDRSGLFVSIYSARGADMPRMDLQGNLQFLWEHPGGVDIYGVLSPDGQSLAMLGWNVEGNMWLMENF